MGIGRSVQGKERCEVCGREQEPYFEVHLGGERHVFDSFECAVHGMMPRCGNCGGMILGPGIAVENKLYCGYSCASLSSIHDYEARLLPGEQPQL